jgi:hypothetical protein
MLAFIWRKGEQRAQTLVHTLLRCASQTSLPAVSEPGHNRSAANCIGTGFAAGAIALPAVVPVSVRLM